jgi:tetratricopeptide (TPR) repeat protein
VELDPGNAEALGVYAVYASSLGRYDLTLQYSERARTVDPMSFSANLLPVHAASRLGRTETALSYAKRLRQQFPDDPYAGDVECLARHWVGEHDKALACAMQRLAARAESDPARSELTLLIGAIWEILGERSLALQHYEQAAAAPGAFDEQFAVTDAWLARLSMLRLRSDPAELKALAADAHTLAADPVYWPIADTLARAGRRAEALAVYRALDLADMFRTESRELDYAMPGLAQMIALARASGGDPEAEKLVAPMLEHSASSLRHGARHYESHLQHARGLMLAGRSDEALAQLDAAIDASGAPFALALLETDPVFDSLKDDGRFRTRLDRLRERQAELRRRTAETLRAQGLWNIRLRAD